jgi:hypothetical protein
MIINNTETLRDVIEEGKLSVVTRPQKEPGAMNYYFSLPLQIVLFNPTVLLANSKEKYLVFRFEKDKYSSLLTMLNSVHNQLSYLTKVKCKTFYGLTAQVNDHFTLRCSLPLLKGKFNIDCSFEGQQEPFFYPRPGSVPNRATIEIKNVWESKGRAAYHIELKSIEF